jgi:hypothetical protein
MKGIIIILFFIITSFEIKAQAVGVKVKSYIDHLKVDSVMIYNYICVGGYYDDSCYREKPTYLFWINNGRSFVKRFDVCQDFKTIELSGENPLTFYIRNKKVIELEQIKEPTFIVAKRGKKKSDTLSIMTTHSCHHDFNFYLGNEFYKKSADDFDLNTYESDGMQNIYYTQNQNSIFNKLIIEVKDLIVTLRRDEAFVKE